MWRTTCSCSTTASHLIDAAARLVDDLLGRCPWLRVLATNREPLGILGETLCRPVPPLDRRTGLWPVIADSELVTEL